MKGFEWLLAFLLATSLFASAQNQVPVTAPTIKLASLTILVKDYDAAAKLYS